MKEVDRNQRIAEKICRDFQWNGQTFQPGQFVALLDGNVVATARDLEGALKALRSVNPDPTSGMIVEVNASAMDVVR